MFNHRNINSIFLVLFPDHYGRRTPLQSDLGTIDEKKESPKPTPRFRQKSGDEEKPTSKFRPKSEEGYKFGERALSPDFQKKKLVSQLTYFILAI